MGTNERYENGQFVVNIEKSLEDKNFFAFTEYPLIASISGDSKMAPYHPLVDKGTWGFLITRKVYHDYFVKNEGWISQASNSEFNEFVQYVNDLPSRLLKATPGNHFLLVGKHGAQKIAAYVEYFENEMNVIKQELAAFFGVQSLED
jgi:hypothetical protein